MPRIRAFEETQMVRAEPRDHRAAREAYRARLLRDYAQRRDPADLERLVMSYRGLARRLARHYGTARGGKEDLEQAAYEGLIKAIDRFDPDRGAAFTSFAVPTILGELRRHVRETAWPAHVPRRLQERIGGVRNAAASFMAQQRRNPTVRELELRTGWNAEEIVEALEAPAALSVASLDSSSSADDEGLMPSERIGDEDPGYEHVECLVAIEQTLPALTRAQRHALRLRFGEDLSYRQMARRLGISRAAAARELDSAVTALRQLPAA
jgi:RNA polymerase sigma-B factor